jgi:hypothetical protein
MSIPIITVHKSQYKYVECPECGGYTVGRIGGAGVTFNEVSQLTDIARAIDLLMATPSVFAALYNSQITGWREGVLEVARAPELADVNIRYHELVVIGHTHNYTQWVSLPIEEECASCGRKSYRRPLRGIDIPIECWDGSDIFLIDELPGIYVITESFRRVIEENMFTSVTITPVEEWESPQVSFAKFVGLSDE